MNSIRSATPEEFPRLLDIQVACIRDLAETYSSAEIEAWTSYIEHEGADRYAAYANRVFTDEAAQDIVGFVSWSQQDPRGSAIECLYTLKEYRQRGIGRLLLREAEDDMSPDTTIHVRSTLNARPFYERNGYTYTGDAISRAGFRIALLEKHKNKE